jgi:hypothetical protein
MFGIKSNNKNEKMTGPRPIASTVEKHMVSDMKTNPEWIPFLRSVIRHDGRGENAYDIRIIDEADAKAKGIKIENFLTLNEHPDLILYEGWVDEATKRTELIEKKKVNLETRIYDEGEIAEQIEAMQTPGSTVFFYQARGPGHGGPLGMGAAVVELNPKYDGKKEKKYNIYFANVIDGKPTEKRTFATQLEKAKDAAKYVKEAHVAREYAS